jgi:hypothetical protein
MENFEEKVKKIKENFSTMKKFSLYDKGVQQELKTPMVWIAALYGDDSYEKDFHLTIDEKGRFHLLTLRSDGSVERLLKNKIIGIKEAKKTFNDFTFIEPLE